MGRNSLFPVLQESKQRGGIGLLERCHAEARMTARLTILISSFGSTHENEVGCLHRILCLLCVIQEQIPDAQFPEYIGTPLA
ncbi:hypothetical protein TNCV_4626751 [Trichonephila clavipes]|nr:hypothetical protein TNCV_4626751 [Trichonephila clavipes]